MIPLTKLRRRGYNSNYPLNRGLIRNWASDILDTPQAGTGSTTWRSKFPGMPHTLTINGGALWYPALNLQGQKRSIYLDGSNDSLKAGTVPFTTYPFSISFWHKTWSASSAMLWWCGEADYGNWRAFYGTSSTTAINAIAIQNTPTRTASTTIGYTQDKWYLYTGVYASTTNRSCYINGGNKGTSTDSCDPTNVNEFFIGAARRFGSPDTNTAGNFADIRIWNRALSDGEVSQLYHDSVRSFDRMNNSITYMFFGYTAPAGALEGSTTLTFSTTGASVGTGALAASSTLTFSTTGASVGVGAVTGASDLTFSTVGELSVGASLEGSSTLTFSTTGAVIGSGVLAGASDLTFSDTGNLLGSGVLVATTTLTFSDTGDLLGSGALSGPTTLEFTTAGALFSGTEMYGNTSLTFTTTGDAVGIGVLSGPTTLTFSTTGVSVGVGVLNASTTVDFSTSGLINGIAACAANTTLDFSTTGLLGGTGTLLGNSSISFTLTGDIALGLAGSTSLAFTLTGNVVGIGAISGTSSLTFGVSGGFSVDETGILMDASPNIFWFGTIV